MAPGGDQVGAADPSSLSFTGNIRPLLAKYCFDCHGDSGKPKGDLNLEAFATEAGTAARPAVWKKVLDALAAGDMPPAEKPQPTAIERDTLISFARQILARPALGGARDPGQPLLRRLTRLEYNNTVRDLLGLDMDVFMFPERLPFHKEDYFHPEHGRLPDRLRLTARELGQQYPVLLRQEGLPGDNQAGHGFNNRGDALNLDPLRLEKYVALARDIFDQPGLLQVADRLRELFPDGGSAPVPVADVRRVPAIVTAAGVVAPRDNVAKTAAGSAFTLDVFRERLAAAFAADRGGVYDVSQNRDTVTAGKGGLLQIAYGRNAIRTLALNPNADLWNVDFATAEAGSGGALFTNRERNRKEFYLGLQGAGARSAGVVELGVVVLSRRGQQGTVGLTARFDNGEWKRLEVPLLEGAGRDNTFVSFAAPAGRQVLALEIDGSRFSGEFVLLDDLAFITRDDPASVAVVTGRELPVVQGRELPAEDSADVRKPAVRINPALARRPVRERLAHFMERAFRRPVTSGEVGRYLQLHAEARRRGATEEESLKAALRGVLCSPQFLYRVERPVGGAGPVRALGDFELANRLSYFLWSTLPDDELFAAARRGGLNTEAAIEQQVQRMLRDFKVRELSESFAFQWLQLHELFGSRPDPERFGGYYSGPQGKHTMAAAMIAEPLLLFETLLIENRSILELVDADYAWLNTELIRHYGLQDQLHGKPAAPQHRDRDGQAGGDNSVWLRVKLPDRNRGGVFTTAGVLTLTSLPLRTSPVYRGAWMLETLFNRPPPPPPAMVAELGGDDREFLTRGLTVRQKLEEHRRNPNCAGCHRRIDDLGFALENFDPVGRWRVRQGALPVDAAGELSGDRRFDGPAGFKDALLKQRDDFVRAFIEHLLSYALGRRLEYFDDPSITEIMARAEPGNCRLATLIVEVCRSHPFRHTRNELAATPGD